MSLLRADFSFERSNTVFGLVYGEHPGSSTLFPPPNLPYLCNPARLRGARLLAALPQSRGRSTLEFSMASLGKARDPYPGGITQSRQCTLPGSMAKHLNPVFLSLETTKP